MKVELQQLCPTCHGPLQLSETLANIDVWCCPNRECGYEDRSGLTMEGLPFEVQQFCRGVHRSFLTKHNLPIMAAQDICDPNTATGKSIATVLLEMKFDCWGGLRRLTENPESDLQRDLERELERRFEFSRGK